MVMEQDEHDVPLTYIWRRSEVPKLAVGGGNRGAPRAGRAEAADRQPKQEAVPYSCPFFFFFCVCVFLSFLFTFYCLIICLIPLFFHHSMPLIAAALRGPQSLLPESSLVLHSLPRRSANRHDRPPHYQVALTASELKSGTENLQERVVHWLEMSYGREYLLSEK